VYQISPKSGDFLLRYGDLTIFKMAEDGGLEFYVSKNGFVEKPIYDFL